MYQNTYSDAQLFKFVEYKDGIYNIATKVTKDNSNLDVYNHSTGNGANVCQWQYTGNENQMFRLIPVSDESSSETDSSIQEDSSLNIDSSSQVESSEIDEDYTLDKDMVKHQLKNNGDTIRFVMIADEQKVAASKSGEVEVRLMDMNDASVQPITISANIKSVYKALYAGGKKITAPEGKLFIISPEASGVSQEGRGAVGVFDLDSYSPTRYASLYQNIG